MEASTTFENLLEQMQKSNLNFKLERSPFSAVISLKKSFFVRDKSGNISSPVTNTAVLLDQLRAENKSLRNKVLDQEKTIESLKSEFENTVDECEELNKVKIMLENQIKSRIFAIKKESIDETPEFEANKLKLKFLENECLVKTRELEVLLDQNKNYKNEIKNVNLRHQKLSIEIRHIKSEKEVMEKDLRNVSVAFKSSKKEIAEITKTYSIGRKKFEIEIKKLLDYKQERESEVREVKKKEKKMIKKERKEAKEVAKIEVNKMKVQRQIKFKESEDVLEVPEDKPKVDIETFCDHTPQCILKPPSPPPHGPRTQKQSELDIIIAKHEAYESFAKYVLEFMEEEPGDTLDTTIAKLEALKAMLEPATDENTKESTFDELIRTVKETKHAIQELDNEDYDDDYFQAMEEDQGLPRHYWGGEDGNELIFSDGD